jgi:hypothetical protein
MSEREFYARHGDVYAVASTEFRRVKIEKGNEALELDSLEAEALAHWLLKEAFQP